MAAHSELGAGFAQPEDPLTEPYRATMAWMLGFVAVDGMQRELLFDVLRRLLRDEEAQGKRPILVVSGTLCGVLGVSVDRLLLQSGVAWTPDPHSGASSVSRGRKRKVTSRRMVCCDVKRGVVFRPRTDIRIRIWKAKAEELARDMCTDLSVDAREGAGVSQGL